jgi:hypothetical protein
VFRATFSAVVTAAVLSCGTHQAQGDSFHNLGFEEAVIHQTSPGSVSGSDALPHWTTNNTWVLYDTVPLGSTCIAIHDKLDPYYPPINGNYSITLHSGSYAAYISQVGDVPGNARSLRFVTNHLEGTIRVSVDGTVIPTFTLSDVGGVETLGGDVSAYASRNVDLRIELVNNDPGNSYPYASLDGIAFSDVAVPEPSTLVLLGIGAATLIACGWRRRR